MLRRVIQQGGVYALAAVVAKVGAFVLLLFYVNEEVLAKAEFGYLGVIDATKAIGLLVAGAGLPIGLLRFASSRDLSDTARAAVPATALALSAAIALGLGVGIWTGAPVFSGWLFGHPGRAELFRWLAVYVAFRSVADVSLTELRHREATGRFVLAGLLEVVLLVSAVVYFLVVRGEGLEGVLKGYAVSAAGLAAVLTPALLRRVERRVAWPLVRPLLAFGLPLIASGLASRALNVGDRYLIVLLLGAEATAEYEVAARFGGLVNTLAVQSFGLAFTVLGLKALDGTSDPTFHRRAFRHFAALAGGAALVLGLGYSDLVALLPTQDDSYGRADGVVLMIAGGFGLYGLYYIAVNVLYAAGRTRTVALVVGLAAAVNVGLNLALIPRLGIGGAALATLLAYAVLAYGTARAAEQSVRVGYGWGSVAVVAVAVGVLWGAGQVADAWALGPRLALRGALVLAYPAVLVAGGVYRREDFRAARRLVAARRGREHGGSTPD